MEVPSDSFGGQSPERKAATALRTLFTFCAVKIIMSQLSGSGRGGLGAYNSQQYDALEAFLEEEPLRDGDAWLKGLLKRNEMLALRIMEVRQAYACESFEWDQLRRLVERGGQDANVKLLRGQAEEAFLRQGAPGPVETETSSD
ncbi:hypothetical protein WJX81_001169 [Elliptochloris bilobata]|uniref:Uncharacterized protein n=1 Tax=Elliptochloris bilobata TaxID=381761 RepID=A0AAW1QIY7_9CHLO